MKGFKRLISVILAVMMLITAFPTTVLAFEQKEDATGETDSIVWNYTASTDTLYINSKKLMGMKYYDNPLTSKTEHYLPTLYTDVNNVMRFWNGSFSKLIVGNNITSLGSVRLGYDEKSGFYTYPELTEVEFEENSKMLVINSYDFYKLPIKSITIPDMVDEIESYAFSESELEEIIIPDNVTKIRKYAFSKCNQLTNVVLQSDEAVISEGAFSDCKNLTDITLPADLTNLSDKLFEGCKSLVSVNLPDSVETIGNRAFYGSGIESMVLPAETITIGSSAFATSAISHIAFNNKLQSIKSYAFDDTNIDEITLPSSVKSLEDHAFRNCKSLVTANINADFSTLSPGVFKGCSSLENVDASNIDTVMNDAFNGTQALTNLTMPLLRTASDRAFYQSGITSIVFAQRASSNAYAYLGYSAFAGCQNLTNVQLPDDLFVISGKAFQGCSRLRKIVIPQFAQSITSYAFSATKLNSVTFLNSNTEIGEAVFDKVDGAYDSELTFWGYNGSKAQIFANENGIAFNPFDVEEGESPEVNPPEENTPPTENEIQQNKLRGTWDNGTWKIMQNDGIYIYGTGEMNRNIAIDYNGESKTFGELCNENNVNRVYIADGITSIADRFIYTENGCCVYNVYAPASLEKIGSHAFENSNLTNFLPNNSTFTTGLRSMEFVLFSGNVTEIGEYAFANCPYLSVDVILPFDITEIKEGVFYNTPIKSVAIFGYVTKIDKKAFANCRNLNRLSIPCTASLYIDNEHPENNSVGYMDDGEKLYLTVYCREDSDAYRYAQANGFTVSISKGNAYATGRITSSYKKLATTYNYTLYWDYYPDDNSLCIRKGSDNSSSLLNKQYSDKIVTASADDAVTIEENSFIRNLIESGSMTSKYNPYVYGSMQVDTVVVDEDITELSCSDLFGAFNPKHIVLPESLTKLQFHTFRGCDRLETVYIPESVTSIEDDAFADCYNLVGVNLGGVKKIDNGMFENRKRLQIVHMNKIETIGDNAFSRCMELQDITIPDTTTSIGTRAFYKCIKAQQIKLGTGVREIAENAFDDIAFCEKIIINSNFNNNSQVKAFNDIGTSTTGVELEFGKYVTSVDFSAFSNTRVTDINLGMNVSNISNTKYLPYAEKISVDQMNSTYYENRNMLYNFSKTLVYVPAQKSSVTIPDGIEAIAGYALYNTNATSIVVPSSVTAIGNYAFAESKTLKNIDIERGTQTIGEGAFENCTAIRSFYSPSSITTIGDKAFKGCQRLSSVILPSHLTSIGVQAFEGCVSLIGMVINENVATIGDGAYRDCFGLEEIYIWYNTNLGNNVFDGDDNLTIFTMAGSDAYRYAREFGIPYNAYTDDDAFYDLCGDKTDIYAGYIGLCTDGHGDIEWLTVYGADCENDGYIIGVCEYCSEILDEKHIDAYGHDYKLTTRIPATATARGMKVYTCIRCGESNCEYIEPTGEDVDIETHTVKGSVVIASDKEAESGKSAARNVSVVINDMVVAKTDENGEFELALETGTYEVQLVYAYGFTRTIYIVVEDEDLTYDAIPIIGCDFNKDGRIDNDDLALLRMVISSSANDPSYLDYVDINNDGYINAKDMAYILTCKGINSKDYTYSQIIIRK